jgi:hypothetical protein
LAWTRVFHGNGSMVHQGVNCRNFFREENYAQAFTAKPATYSHQRNVDSRRPTRQPLV